MLVKLTQGRTDKQREMWSVKEIEPKKKTLSNGEISSIIIGILLGKLFRKREGICDLKVEFVFWVKY